MKENKELGWSKCPDHFTASDQTSGCRVHASQDMYNPDHGLCSRMMSSRLFRPGSGHPTFRSGASVRHFHFGTDISCDFRRLTPRLYGYARFSFFFIGYRVSIVVKLDFTCSIPLVFSCVSDCCRFLRLRSGVFLCRYKDFYGDLFAFRHPYKDRAPFQSSIPHSGPLNVRG